MTSPLERLTGPGGALVAEPSNATEFEGLVRSELARLKDAENKTLSLESRFDLAYNAAHALCLALRHHGFRPAKRYIVFQTLRATLCATERNTRALVTWTSALSPTSSPRHASLLRRSSS